MSDQPSKKRKAEKQLVKDQDPESEEEEESTGFQTASAEELAKRKMFRIKPQFKQQASTGKGIFKGISLSGPPGGSGEAGAAAPSFPAFKMPSAGAEPAKKEFGSSSPQAQQSFSNFFTTLKENSSPASKAAGTPKDAPLASPLEAGEKEGKTTLTSFFNVTPATPEPSAKPEEGKQTPPATSSGFSFTAPTSFGTKFAPSWGKGGFGAATPDTAGKQGSFLQGGENKMSKTATEVANTPNTRDALETPNKSEVASQVFTPAAPSVVKTPATKLDATEDRQDGEEGEAVLLAMHGVILMEFGEDKTWKERGTGVVKVNKMKDNEKSRIIMRREPTHALLLNESLGPNGGFKLVQSELKEDAKVFSVLVLDPATKESKHYCFKTKVKANKIGDLYALIKARQAAMA